MTAQVLLLTPWYSPHKVIAWEAAVTLLFLDKVDVVEEYEHTIASPSVAIRAPAVVRLKRALRSMKRGVKFSRVNVMTRDGFRCQYCGDRRALSELTYDHVVPRSKGGRTDWDNIVTACRPCNARKGGRTPEEAGMRLLSRPHKPKTLPVPSVTIDARKAPAAWASYVAC